jgi:membrane-bound ClpP family serine protease
MDFFVVALLVFVGCLLLVLEVAVMPGFGITGIAGAAAMLGSVAYAFFFVGLAAGWCTLGIVLASLSALIVWAIKGKSIDRLALKKSISSTVKESDAAVKVGDRGVSLTRLALTGDALFGDNVFEVSSVDGFIDEKVPVEVVRVQGGAIYVKMVNKE